VVAKRIGKANRQRPFKGRRKPNPVNSTNRGPEANQGVRKKTTKQRKEGLRKGYDLLGGLGGKRVGTR